MKEKPISKLKVALIGLLAGGVGLGQMLSQIRGLDGSAPTSFFGNGGRTPKEWGMSRECARMVRNHRLRRGGVGGQHI